ncbi:MAG: bifunctional transaldolase/phosoglucose isomerase [Proteobacteria bacterium]|nr:bifunctional transaldolase/phosoglucose isomerase [Pseudomonadota bacterium]
MQNDKNLLFDLQEFGQSVWYDNIRRALLTSGELRHLVEQYGVSGVTSNPVIFENAIAGAEEYDHDIMRLSAEGLDDEAILTELMTFDIRLAADVIAQVFKLTNGHDGYVSIEVNPAHAHDTESTVKEAKELHAIIDRPNILIKVPATEDGIKASEELLYQGYNVNVTLLFSVERYEATAKAYVRALERRAAEGKSNADIYSVASFFVSRVDTIVDSVLEEKLAAATSNDDKSRLHDLIGSIAVANAKLAYMKGAEIFGVHFRDLRISGARPQKLLWASTGTKNPLYSDVKYVDELVGKDTINTMPLKTLMAFHDHGKVRPTLGESVDIAIDMFDELRSFGIKYPELATRLETEGLDAFNKGYANLVACIAGKREDLEKRKSVLQLSMGALGPKVDAAVEKLGSDRFMERLLDKDAELWSSHEPVKKMIGNSLGWLAMPEEMDGMKAGMLSFAENVKKTEVAQVVLLGMGGSSLAPLVMAETFGTGEGWPELRVLDSTDPEAIKAVEDSMVDSDGAHVNTLFIVSSKSGTTIEPLSLFEHFWAKVKEKKGESEAGMSFIAITDPGTALSGYARKYSFRQCFANPADIGGRFSVLSFFGLIPAALTGIDIGKLLHSARSMETVIDPCVKSSENPALLLGATLGVAAKAGRDKATFVLSDELSSFGLWAEQLIAESTGKEGKGIVPISGEPLGSPDAYSDDRFFIYMGVGDIDDETEAKLVALEEAGHPVVRIRLHNIYDMGGEFYRWEVATAVAGNLLEINPFDQPNVELAKNLTRDLLESGAGSSGGLKEGETALECGSVTLTFNPPAVERLGGSSALKESDGAGAIKDFIALSDSKSYIGLLAYLNTFDPKAELLLKRIRSGIMDSSGAATQFGFGPRYLHSTGQLHKGGPSTGLFVVVSAGSEVEIAVPGREFSFSTLEASQALGDISALSTEGRPVVHIRLKDSSTASLEELENLFKS